MKFTQSYAFDRVLRNPLLQVQLVMNKLNFLKDENVDTKSKVQDLVRRTLWLDQKQSSEGVL